MSALVRDKSKNMKSLKQKEYETFHAQLNIIAVNKENKSNKRANINNHNILKLLV